MAAGLLTLLQVLGTLDHKGDGGRRTRPHLKSFDSKGLKGFAPQTGRVKRPGLYPLQSVSTSHSSWNHPKAAARRPSVRLNARCPVPSRRPFPRPAQSYGHTASSRGHATSGTKVRVRAGPRAAEGQDGGPAAELGGHVPPRCTHG